MQKVRALIFRTPQAAVDHGATKAKASSRCRGNSEAATGLRSNYSASGNKRRRDQLR
jgi:hypothetical protein